MALASVIATTTTTSAKIPLVINTLLPFKIKSSPSLFALVRIPWRSDPASRKQEYFHLSFVDTYVNNPMPRASVQGVKSLGGHFACLCRGFEFYEVKKKFVIIFQKENGNTFTLFIIFIVKSLQKEQNSTNLLL